MPEALVKISYSLQKATSITIKLVDVTSNLITTVIKNNQPAGYYELDIPLVHNGFTSGKVYYHIHDNNIPVKSDNDYSNMIDAGQANVVDINYGV
jgi:hypothetical protein